MSAETVISPRVAENPRLGSWLTIEPDGTIRVHTGKIEYGQGILTAIAQLVADELDVSIGRVVVDSADTDRSPDEGITSGSMSIEDSSRAVRRVAADARHALLQRAAARLGTPPNQLNVEDGLIHGVGGSVSYADLADPDLMDVEVAGAAELKSASERRVIGTNVPRVDLPPKVMGAAAFIQDLDLPGMLHGRVVRPPSYSARLVALDEAQLRAMPGVITVIRDGSFVGIVAEREEQAIRALNRARRIATWQETPSLPTGIGYLTQQPSEEYVLVDELNHPASAADRGRELTSEFARPFLAHASIGPSCAIARLEVGRYEVHTHSQGIFNLRQELAKTLLVSQQAVRVIHVEGAGCYGANGADDVALDAALLARATPGRPVRVQWMRDDEFAWEPFGTAAFVRLTACLDPTGGIVEWRHDTWSHGYRNRLGPDSPAITNLLGGQHLAQALEASRPGPPVSPLAGAHRNAEPLYAFPRRRVVTHHAAHPRLRVSALRSLGAHTNVFAIESFMDEIGAVAGADPIEHRIRYLVDPRARAVLETVGRAAIWSRRPAGGHGRGFGVGFARYKNAGAYVAVIAEVAIERSLELVRVWAAVDVGTAVNPDGVRNQAEGGIIQAASWTLKEEVTFDDTRITSRSWEEYPILSFEEIPEIHVELIDRPHLPPVGVGEAFAGPTAAAIANAICDATGTRVRRMPFTHERLMRALAT